MEIHIKIILQQPAIDDDIVWSFLVLEQDLD